MELGSALSSALVMIQRGRNDAYTAKLKEEINSEWFSSTLLVDLIAQANASYGILSDKAGYILPYTVVVNENNTAELIKDVLHKNSFVKAPPSICMLFLNSAYSRCCEEFATNPNKIYDRWDELTQGKVDGEIVTPSEIAEKILEKTVLHALETGFNLEALREKAQVEVAEVDQVTLDNLTPDTVLLDDEVAVIDEEPAESDEYDGPHQSVDPFKPL